MSTNRLLLIYDADTGFLAAALDSARKLLDANPCALCSITHGLFGERPAYRRWRRSVEAEVVTLHRDELDAELRADAGPLPAVLAESPEGRHVLLGPDELDACRGDVKRFAAMLREAQDRRAS